MKTLLIGVLVCFLASGVSLAGKNAGGSLIVHTTGMTAYRAWNCEDLYEDPGSCENAITQSDNWGDDSAGIGIWLLAAFHETSDPGVSAIGFGLRHNLPPGWFYTSTFCGPEGTLQSPDPGWPDDWLGAGNVVGFGSPIVGDRLFPFYYVVAWGIDGGRIGTGIHPNFGFAAFQDNSMPPVLDRTSNFGEMRWFEPGYNECPEADPVLVPACCLSNGICVYLDYEDCLAYGGAPRGAGSNCDSDPCTPAYVPEPKEQDTTWGGLRTGYR